MNPYRDVLEFHEKFNQRIGVKPEFPDAGERFLRIGLLNDEVEEYLESEQSNDFVNLARELVDIIYIVCGTAISYGIPLDKVWDAIHEANMRKLGPDGKPIYREDGKILKPPGWTPANINEILGY